MPRLFIAVPVGADVRHGITTQLTADEAALRRTPARNLHITLEFLGNVDTGRIASLQQAMKLAAAPYQRPFTLEARGVGAFPNVRRASVVWVGVAGEVEPLLRLQERLHGQLRASGFGTEERSFRPHITVARSKRPGPLPPDLLAQKGRSFGSWTVDRLLLVESRLLPGGAEHGVIEEVRFA